MLKWGILASFKVSVPQTSRRSLSVNLPRLKKLLFPCRQGQKRQSKGLLNSLPLRGEAPAVLAWGGEWRGWLMAKVPGLVPSERRHLKPLRTGT